MYKCTKSLAVIILSFLLLPRICEAAVKIDMSATVSAVVGDVAVQRGGHGDWVAAKEGDALKSGDRVKTGSKSSCLLKWNRENVLKLTAFTNISIDQLEKSPAAGADNSALGLWSGKVYASAKKLNGPQSTFEVRTPAAIAGVRGTEMAVGLQADDTTSVECYKGLVSVKSKAGGEVLLGEKQKTTVKKDAPPDTPQQIEPSDEEGFKDLEESAGASLEVMQPVGDLETDTTPVLIVGTTAPGGSVNVNGQTVTADDKGGFSASVDLVEGVNHIKIEASNKKGDTKTTNRSVKYRPKEPVSGMTGGVAQEDGSDRQKTETAAAAISQTAGKEHEEPIELVVITPPEGFVTRDAMIVVSGTAKAGTKITVNGIPTEVSPQGKTFSVSIPLPAEGENEIVVTGTKGANFMTVTRRVSKDTTPPPLTVTMPAGGSFDIGAGCVKEGDMLQCTLIGRTEFGAQFTVNGAQYSSAVRPDGSFMLDLMLGQTETMITLAATDSAGNRSSVILTRTIDVTKVAYIEMSVSPSTIVSNKVDTATVTVRLLNFLREPVDGVVTLSAPYGGTLSATALTTIGGEATAVFTAGVGGNTPVTVPITAVSGSVSGGAQLILMPDVPPQH